MGYSPYQSFSGFDTAYYPSVRFWGWNISVRMIDFQAISVKAVFAVVFGQGWNGKLRRCSDLTVVAVVVRYFSLL